MPEDFALLARGREADVFDRGDGRVIRRYRERDVPAHEVRAMNYARSQGYPVPEVIAVAGRDLVLERITGPTMQEVLSEDFEPTGRGGAARRTSPSPTPDQRPRLVAVAR